MSGHDRAPRSWWRFPPNVALRDTPVTFADHIRNVIRDRPHPMLWVSEDDVRWCWPEHAGEGYVLRYDLATRTFTSEHMRMPTAATFDAPDRKTRSLVKDGSVPLDDEITALLRATLTDQDLAHCAAASIRFAAGTWRP